MSITNYSELVDAIQAWIGEDIENHTEEFVDLAEGFFNARLRVKRMLERWHVDSSLEYLPLPPTCLAVDQVFYTSAGKSIPLQYISPEYATVQDTVSTGAPQFYTGLQGEIQVIPAPDAEYQFDVWMFAKITALAGTSTNWLLTNYPQAYLFASLMFANTYLRQDRERERYFQLAEQEIGNIHRIERIDRRKSSSLTMRPL